MVVGQRFGTGSSNLKVRRCEIEDVTASPAGEAVARVTILPESPSDSFDRLRRMNWVLVLHRVLPGGDCVMSPRCSAAPCWRQWSSSLVNKYSGLIAANLPKHARVRDRTESGKDD